MYQHLTELGVRVHAICARRGLKLGDVAHAVNMTPSYFSRVLRNDRPEPRWTTMIALADAMGVSLDELAGRDASE